VISDVLPFLAVHAKSCVDSNQFAFPERPMEFPVAVFAAAGLPDGLEWHDRV
jgi:hypothetical protein